MKGLIYASITALCWAFLAILLKNALEFSSSETIVAFRMFFAFSLSLPLIALHKPNYFKILKRPPLLLVLGSLGLAYNYLGYMKGISLSGAANAQIMIQAGPLVLMFLGFALYKEGIKKAQVFFLFIALSGFYLYFKDQLQFINKENLLAADAWILTAALSWVFYSLAIRFYSRKGFDTMELNLIVFLVCTIVLSLNANLSEVFAFNLQQWLLLSILGLNTLVAYGCYGAALKYAPASQVAIIITLNPILTLLIITFGGPLFDFIPFEPTTFLGYLGAALVVGGIMFSTLLGVRKQKA